LGGRVTWVASNGGVLPHSSGRNGETHTRTKEKEEQRKGPWKLRRCEQSAAASEEDSRLADHQKKWGACGGKRTELNRHKSFHKRGRPWDDQPAVWGTQKRGSIWEVGGGERLLLVGVLGRGY